MKIVPTPLTETKRNSLDLLGPSAWFKVGYFLLVFTFVLRIFWYPIVVSDYTYFGKLWFNTLQSHSGLTAFIQPFADYAPLYLYLLKVLTFIPVSSLYSEKTLSFLFDILIAYFAYRILAETSVWRTRKDVLFMATVTFLSLPTVMVNSSLWGQSDAIYSAGVVASLFYILTNAPLFAAIAYGFAVSIKLQAIFFLPIFLGYLLKSRETWKYVLIPPLIFALSIVPAWFGGGGLGYWLFIYFSQAKEYPWLSVSAQSVFAFFQPLALSIANTSLLFWMGVLAATLVAWGTLLLMKSTPIQDSAKIVLISFASVLLLPYLLPRMHERYFYLADLFSVLYAFYRPRRSWVPILVVLTSLLSYMPFLSGQVSFLSWAHVDLRVPAAILLVPVGIVLFDVWRTMFVRPEA